MPDESKIDLSKYRTDELASRVAEILSVPESIRTVLWTGLCAILCLQVANSLLYVTEDNAIFVWLLASIYALAIGIVLGFLLGVPLLWVYRRTIGGCVRYLILRMKTDSLSAEDEVAVERSTDKIAQELSENATSIERAIDQAMGYTEYATQMLRRALMLPLQLGFTAVSIVAMLPIVVYWYWS